MKRNIREHFYRKWEEHVPRDAKRKAGQHPPEYVSAVRDVPYKCGISGSGKTERKKEHFLDIFFPENHEGTLPVIVDVHGGGWVYGNKELNEYYCMELAKLGFVVFDINYRLAPGTDLKGQVQDVTAALNWVFHHAMEYHGNKEKVFLTGDSAGAQLALLTCAAASNKNYQEIYAIPRLEGKIQALGLTCPVTLLHEMSRSEDEMQREWMRVVYDITEGSETWEYSPVWKYSDPKDYLEECSLPNLYILTTKGDANYHWQAQRLHQILQEKGIDHTYRVWEGKGTQELGHVFNVLYPEYEDSRKANGEMTRFFLIQ